LLELIMRSHPLVAVRAARASALLTLVALSVDAQAPVPAPPAPVPAQIASARRVFISNAGSDSYGPLVFYELARYEGGPDRLYNSFYAALKEWGRLELVAAPSQADVVYVVRFRSPAVAQHDSTDFVYDPQLTLTIIDPTTQVALWSLTEHIEPAWTRAGANRNFDRAVSRFVARTKQLIESPLEAARAAANPPVGADRVFVLKQRASHAGTGALIGSVVVALREMSMFEHRCQPTQPPTPCSPGSAVKFLLADVGGAAVGALIGWMLPVGHP
jgi:hypothetical protein